MTGDGLPPLREVIARFGLGATRALGQNFLFDLNLTGRIARAASPLAGCTIVEIGPGPGGLTRALLAEGAERIVAVERDERAIPALAEIAAAYPGRLEIHAADALAVDWRSIVSGPAKLVANLPYNIATPLLIGWLADPWPPWYQSMTLMFQREVADRIVARPGDSAYGRLSIICQWRCKVSRLFDVNRSAFTPPPKVTSSIVQFHPRTRCEPECRVQTLERVTAAAFGQRRKMLRSSLKTLGGDTLALLAKAGISGELRAEDLSVADFGRFAQLLDDAG
ncbi:MAG: 16S rRNA (adenine(1518)-N(6)/adenine(1519)-N(6))-dimethyltransferase RsmA [Rhizobiales bacterium]|nr:16S rRNA (adenine(1518)-N(6)/adenine(1519)-N(6))-dimethyltransferase RsmA [Hyphomicrobiales bacterium]